MKIKFSFSIILIFMGLSVFCQDVDTEYMRMNKLPYLQAVTENSATILFGTSQEAVPAVLIGENAELLTKVENSNNGLTDAGGKWHKVRLNHLKPDTKYYYKAVARQILQFTPYYTYYGDTIASKICSFKTRSLVSDTVKFVLLNDIHSRNELLTHHIENQSFTPDFYFYNGDMVNDLQNEDDLFKGMINTSTQLFGDSIPFYYARGNHETRGYFARSFYDYIETPTQKPYYGITDGPLHILVMDVGEDKPDGNRYYYGLADFAKYRREQTDWLKEHIKTKAFKNAKYKILCVHIPIFDAETPDKPKADAYRLWSKILKDAGIDLMISAHTHEYFWYPKETSPLGFPILIPDHNQRTEVVVTKNAIKIKVIDSKGKQMKLITID